MCKVYIPECQASKEPNISYWHSCFGGYFNCIIVLHQDNVLAHTAMHACEHIYLAKSTFHWWRIPPPPILMACDFGYFKNTNSTSIVNVFWTETTLSKLKWNIMKGLTTRPASRYGKSELKSELHPQENTLRLADFVR